MYGQGVYIWQRLAIKSSLVRLRSLRNIHCNDQKCPLGTRALDMVTVFPHMLYGISIVNCVSSNIEFPVVIWSYRTICVCKTILASEKKTNLWTFCTIMERFPAGVTGNTRCWPRWMTQDFHKGEHLVNEGDLFLFGEFLCGDVTGLLLRNSYLIQDDVATALAWNSYGAIATSSSIRYLFLRSKPVTSPQRNCSKRTRSASLTKCSPLRKPWIVQQGQHLLFPVTPVGNLSSIVQVDL